RTNSPLLEAAVLGNCRFNSNCRPHTQRGYSTSGNLVCSLSTSPRKWGNKSHSSDYGGEPASLLERVFEFTKSIKNGTKPFDFPARNERSRTDVPHVTGEISHGPHRRAMADPSKTSAALLAPRGSPNDLPSRCPRRDHLCCAQRLPLAASAS